MLTGLAIREFRPDVAGVALHDNAPGAAPVKFTTYAVPPPLLELALLFKVTELIQPLLLSTAPVALIFAVCAFDCACATEKSTPPITNNADDVIAFAFMVPPLMDELAASQAHKDAWLARDRICYRGRDPGVSLK